MPKSAISTNERPRMRAGHAKDGLVNEHERSLSFLSDVPKEFVLDRIARRESSETSPKPAIYCHLLPFVAAKPLRPLQSVTCHRSHIRAQRPPIPTPLFQGQAGLDIDGKRIRSTPVVSIWTVGDPHPSAKQYVLSGFPKPQGARQGRQEVRSMGFRPRCGRHRESS